MPPPLLELLQPLQFLTRPFPRAAVEAAIERREESTPHLLQALEWVVQNPQEAADTQPLYMLHIFALYLLAQFRESRALLSILQLFRLPQYELLTGDVATESLAQILASTYDGDIAALQALVEDRAADEWVRGAAVQALAVLMAQGLHPREQISRYFADLFLARLEREPSNVWTNLISACIDLRLSEHLGAIRLLYEQGVADPFDIGLDEVENEIHSPPDLPEYLARHYRLIDDTIGEMSFWACFKPESEKEDAPNFPAVFARVGDFEDGPLILETLVEEYVAPLPQRRTFPKIGRNDPCPCLSGLKYKKCCGTGARQAG